MLDMKTVMFSYVITNILITVVIFALWRQNRNRYDGLSYWLADYILQAVGLLLILLRDMAPPFISKHDCLCRHYSPHRPVCLDDALPRGRPIEADHPGRGRGLFSVCSGRAYTDCHPRADAASLCMTRLLLDSNLTAEQRRYADIVRSSGETLLSIVNNILDYSKIEAGRMEIETIDFDLHSLIADLVAAMGVQAHTIKGASANVGGERLRNAAFQVETAVRDGDLSRAASLIPEVELQFDRLKEAMLIL